MPSLKLRPILFPFQMEPRREELLHELGDMWDEIGEAEEDRRGALSALEEECLSLYRAKVEQVRQHRAQLKREISDSVAEVAAICATIGEPPSTVHTACSSLQGTGSLKEELGMIAPELAEMRRRRDERRREFADVTQRVARIQEELDLQLGGGQGQSEAHAAAVIVDVDGSDLTTTKLDELRAYLQHLQLEKESRTKKVAELVAQLHSSSLVLGMDPTEANSVVHVGADGAQVQPGDISDGAIAGLAAGIERLREIKRSRMEKLQDLLGSMLELWNLMDTPAEEQRQFQGVACNIAASEDEITEPGALSMAFISNVEAEVVRLENLKECRMKDLVVKKHEELKEIRRRARLPEDDDATVVMVFDAMDSDADRAAILEWLEVQISEAKDLEFNRKDVLEKMDRWQAALEEESWLEEYSRNENRYNVGKGTHLVLKRAEKARALVSKMPVMAEALMAKVVAWEKERGAKFEYDGEVLLDVLDDYGNARKEKEQERKRQRDQRRLLQQVQGAAAAADRDVSSPVAHPPPKNIKNVTRTLSMGGNNTSGGGSARKAAPAAARPGTPSFLKSPLSARRGGSDEGHMMASESFE
ncbi:65-kDa microtubule-associated protein 3 [Zea mays]|uniref:65-kDa microtubule-associated protein 3 n=3 Tax=Zea mays TaxID=4577 RepID=A0A1D6GZA6_MAIZE|nr:65-kDa microtubule-associated protein 3 [Zea mays]AQK68072.1 65-kDa microtubule-associated protein 3 [Zea mays]AQK68074.1 65-kDa microtubule-associated protein 3 [Zea mays]AQK68076.1 65-kDa microtubule-associated protein 3 [Zea mays]AQK68078.1 65-kDa microtubule-associated protein 3 [Zea mays]AQK68079.1 65-kDa microtubule-associated protein 3 [Zea mays]|eukprot:XP_008645194.1 65-kDa microtubule-associated protein 3 [Zea mays]